MSSRGVFQIAEEGLLAHVTFDQKKAKVGLYRHPEDIELPEPAKATIADLEWLADAWTGQKHDYPQRIVYGLSKDGALTASVGFAKGALVSSRFKRESNRASVLERSGLHRSQQKRLEQENWRSFRFRKCMTSRAF